MDAHGTTSELNRRSARGAGRLRLLVVLLVVASLGAAGWYGWRRFLAGDEPVDVTAAPNVKVESLRPNWRLRGSRLEEFDVAPDGAIVVRVGNALYDISSGERLTDARTEVRSFAFVGGALAVATTADKIAFWTEEGLQEVGDAPAGAFLRATQSRDRLLICGGKSVFGLFSLAAQSEPEALGGSPEPILAVAGDKRRHVFAVGRALFEMSKPGEPMMLLALPETSTEIKGVAVNGETIYFASEKVVYALQGWVAIPLVLGIGGQLQVTDDGLLVLDSVRGRLFHLMIVEGPAPVPSAPPSALASGPTETPVPAAASPTDEESAASGGSASETSGSSGGGGSTSGAGSGGSFGGPLTPSVPISSAPDPIVIPTPIKLTPYQTTPVVVPARPFIPPVATRPALPARVP